MDTSGNFVFHHVGQGLFYSGRIHLNGQEKRIVYDCGTSFEKDLLEYEIDEAFKKNDTIDILMISHLDMDHINGVQHLLNRVQKVKFLFMPYVEPEEVLFLVAKYQSVRHRGQYEEYVKLISDISAIWKHEKISNTILLTDLSQGNPSNDGEIISGIDLEDAETIRFKFFRDVEKQEEFDNIYFSENKTSKKKIQVAQYDGTLNFVGRWDFRFYVRDDGKSKRIKFRQSMSNLGLDIRRFADIRNILMSEEQLGKLKKAYKEIYKKLNLTSMVAFHEPMASNGFGTNGCICEYPCLKKSYCFSFCERTYKSNHVSTILFGDADIHTRKECNAIKRYFGDKLEHCAVALV